MILYRDAAVYFVLLAPVLTSLGSGQVAGNAQFADASGSALNQVIVGLTFLNAVVVGRVFGVRLLHIVLILLPAILMLAWILLSVAWSEFPDLTVRRGARVVIEVVSISLLGLSFREPKDILRILFWSFLVVLTLDVCSIAVPSRSVTGSGFAGIHQNKNELGAFLFYALPVFAIGAADRAVARFPLISSAACLCAVVMLVASRSKSAIGIVFLAGVLVELTRMIVLPNVYGRVVLPLMALLASVCIFTFVFALGITETFTLLFGDATLTGRSELWRYALYRHDLQPWTGVGYGALWQVGGSMDEVMKAAQFHWAANQAHDGYIDVLAQLGNIGLFLMIGYLVLTLIRLLRYSASQQGLPMFGLGSYALYLFWGILLFNITESSLFRIGHPVWILFVFVSSCVGGLVFRQRSIAKTKGSYAMRLAK